MTDQPTLAVTSDTGSLNYRVSWPRPATPCDLRPLWKGEFVSFDDWVNFATTRLTGTTGSLGQDVAAICVDALGRRCSCGKDFARARDENAFPVRYFWECTNSEPRPAGDLREAAARLTDEERDSAREAHHEATDTNERAYRRGRGEAATALGALIRNLPLATHSPAPMAGEVERLRAALKWALPLAERAMDDHRLERIRCGHKDISGTYKNGVTWSGIWQAEVDQIEAARAAAHPSTQEGGDRG